MNNSNSYLTGINCESLINDDYGSDKGFDDPACGTYLLTRPVIDRLDDEPLDRRKLACILAQRTCRGFKQAIRIIETFQDFHAPSYDPYVSETLDNLLSQYPSSPIQIFEESLYNLSCKISHPSEKLEIAEIDFWSIYAFDGSSARYIIDQLIDDGYIDYTKSNTTQGPFIIKSKGWEFLSNLHNAKGKGSNQGFLAMWFDAFTEPYFENGFYPAMTEGKKYTCMKIDLKEHNNKICDEVISEIRRSEFLVADCSGDRSNVYFEAGFALGLGIPVIWSVHEKYRGKLQFDTRQYNHIIYDTAEALKEMLSNRIKATIL